MLHARGTVMNSLEERAGLDCPLRQDGVEKQMRRREFIGLAGAAATLGVTGFAQSPGFHINPDRLRSTLESLSAFGRNPEGGVSRLGFSEADLRGRDYVMGLLRQTGCEVSIDAAANIHAIRKGQDPALPVILFGSHIDSVPKGGNFDGEVGSMGAIEVIRALNDHRVQTRHPLELIIFANEEGVHFGNTLFGSRAMIGALEPDELDVKDESGITLGEWLRRYGQDPSKITTAVRKPGTIKAYLELHIEQGAILHRRGIPIGIVEGIVGIQRYAVTVEGFANHAGTTPMNERKDAMVAAAKLIVAVREEILRDVGRQVGTVGFVRVEPGAPNVIPGRVQMPIEIRDLSMEKVEQIAAQIRRRAEAIAQADSVAITMERFMHHPPALMHVRVQQKIEEVCRELRFQFLRMPSGAGQDAQNMAKIAPSGMIFVPSVDGISHSPKELTRWEDCANGAEVLYRTVLAIDSDQNFGSA